MVNRPEPPCRLLMCYGVIALPTQTRWTRTMKTSLRAERRQERGEVCREAGWMLTATGPSLTLKRGVARTQMARNRPQRIRGLHRKTGSENYWLQFIILY